MLLRLFLLAALAFSVSCFAEQNEKPSLRVVAENWVGYTNEDGSGTYFDIIRSVFSETHDVEITNTSWQRASQLVATGRADLIIGAYKLTSSPLLLSEQHIDIEYPIHVIYDESKFSPQVIDDLSHKVVAGKKGYGLENYLPLSTSFYGVDSISGVSKLVANGRIDAALTYSYNLHLADAESSLQHRKIIDEMPIYIGFESSDQGSALQRLFDSKFRQAINAGNIKPLFNSDVEYQHAALELGSSQHTVNWHLIPKVFDHQTQKMTVVPWEVESSEYVNRVMPNTHLNIQLTSFKETQKALTANIGSCVVNYRKRPADKGLLVYSAPYHVFIKPRVFVLSDRAKDVALTSIINDNAISLKDMFKQLPDWRVAVKDNYNIHRKLIKKLGEENAERILPIGNADYNTLINMMMQRRVDAIIIWPSIIADLNDGRYDITKLRSFELYEQIEKDLFTYIACTDDQLGRNVIKHVNALLQVKQHQDIIYQAQLKRMDKQSALKYQRALNLLH